RLCHSFHPAGTVADNDGRQRRGAPRVPAPVTDDLPPRFQKGWLPHLKEESMHSRFATRRLLRSVLSGAALLTVAVAPAAGQDRAGGIIPAGIFSRKEPAQFCPPAYCPPAPCPAPTPAPAVIPPPQPTT